MIGAHLHRYGPDSVGSSVTFARTVGGSWVVFPVPEMWACVLACFKFACPGLWDLFCLVDCDGCSRMWVIGLCLSGNFCIGLKPLFLCFRGGAVRFFIFFLGAFLASCVFFFVGLCPFGNKL